MKGSISVECNQDYNRGNTSSRLAASSTCSFPLFSGHPIFFPFILFILRPGGSIYDRPARRRQRHRTAVVPSDSFHFVSTRFTGLLLIPLCRPENRYYYTGCAPCVLWIRPINIATSSDAWRHRRGPTWPPFTRHGRFQQGKEACMGYIDEKNAAL